MIYTTTEYVTIALFLVAAVINLLPAQGLLSVERMQVLYGLTVDDPSLAILLRHRAALFVMVGALLAVAAFHPPLRTIAIVAGLASMLSYIVIALLGGGYNAELRRVIAADVVGSLALVGAIFTSR